MLRARLCDCACLNLPDLPSKTGILIVGASPADLALTAELRRRGIET
jgi:hypothetical protein